MNILTTGIFESCDTYPIASYVSWSSSW